MLENGEHMKFNLIFMLIFCVGCSQKQLYQVGQNYQKNECIQHAMTETEYRACLRAEELSHQEYQQIRKQVIENKQ